MRGLATHRDWVFGAYVAFAGVMLATRGVSTLRLHAALARFDDCAAHADAECAAIELATARSIDSPNIRTNIAQAQLHAILGEAALSERALGQALGGTRDLDRDTRAAVLLLQGDLAALARKDDEARARWIEAAPLVDDSLVSLRRTRLDADRSALSAALSDQLAAIHAGLDDLLAKARTGDAAAANAQKATVDSQIDRLPQAMRGPFQRASYACAGVTNPAAYRRRAAGLPIAGPSRGATWVPEEPVPPTDDQLRRMPWLKDDYDRRRDSYFRMKALADDQRFNAMRSQTNVLESASDSEEKSVANARRLIEAAFSPQGASR